MSIQVMQAVWQHSKSDGRARTVLLAIADHQGEIGAWPSIATLAKMVNASERSVQRDIQRLQDIGELRVEVQSAPTRQQYKSNLYWVTLPGVTDFESGVTESTSGVTNSEPGVTDSASGVTAGGVLTLNRTLKEPLLETQVIEMFEKFWEQYPKAPKHRTERKADALKQFKAALNRASFDEIMAGAIAHAKDPRENRYKVIAVNWLRNSGWKDITPDTQSKSIWDWEVTK